MTPRTTAPSASTSKASSYRSDRGVGSGGVGSTGACATGCAGAAGAGARCESRTATQRPAAAVITTATIAGAIHRGIARGGSIRRSGRPWSQARPPGHVARQAVHCDTLTRVRTPRAGPAPIIRCASRDSGSWNSPSSAFASSESMLSPVHASRGSFTHSRGASGTRAIRFTVSRQRRSTSASVRVPEPRHDAHCDLPPQAGQPAPPHVAQRTCPVPTQALHAHARTVPGTL